MRKVHKATFKGDSTNIFISNGKGGSEGGFVVAHEKSVRRALEKALNNPQLIKEKLISVEHLKEKIEDERLGEIMMDVFLIITENDK